MGIFKLVKLKNNKSASPFNYLTGQKSKLGWVKETLPVDLDKRVQFDKDLK